MIAQCAECGYSKEFKRSKLRTGGRITAIAKAEAAQWKYTLVQAQMVWKCPGCQVIEESNRTPVRQL